MAEKLRVVIADDEPMVCVVVKKCIHWEELHLELVGIAYDGQELLQRIRKEQPDLVVTDIDMPEMNGLELIEQVRRENLDCKFIILGDFRGFGAATIISALFVGKVLTLLQKCIGGKLRRIAGITQSV